MSHPIFLDYLKKDIHDLNAEAALASNAEHPGITGSIRESAFGKFLEKYLPEGWRIGHGKIIDSSGQTSPEIDLIVYDPRIIPPRFFREPSGFFPIECCLYAIEVKSKSTSQEMQSSIEKMIKLRNLKSSHTHYGQVRRLYLAYDTDLKAQTEFERYLKLDNQGVQYPAITAICVLRHGYWFFSQEKTSDKTITNTWRFFDIAHDPNMISSLLIGILNTIAGFTNSHLGPRPALSPYVTEIMYEPTKISEAVFNL